MKRDPFEKRKQFRSVVAVLAVGILISALLAVALIYQGQAHPHS